MTRWIAFDAATAEALNDKQLQGEPAPVASGDAVAAATASGNGVVVLPSGPGQVIVAQVRRASRPKETPLNVQRWTDKDAIGYQAGGMLGLLDEPVYEEEKPKKWWKRILE